MTYSSGSPGYQPAQSSGSYGASTPSFAKSDDQASKLPFYLTIAVVGLGLAAYFFSFFPLFTVNAPDLGSSGSASVAVHGAGVAAAALLAALLAAVGLLPKARNYTAIVAVIAVLGALLLIARTVAGSGNVSVNWALWVVLALVVLQAIAAVGALLLDAGVITPPAPRPKYDPYAQYAQYGQFGSQPGGYYGQQPGQQQAPYQQHGPQQSGYGSQFGGYSSAPSTGGFAGPSTQQGPQPQGQQHGTSTPPTGFPSFSSPPSFGSGQETQATTQGNSSNHGQGQHGQGQHGQQSHGPGQSQSPSGPTQS